MKLRDYTIPELNIFRELCNFTESEREVFELRAKDKSNVEIAMTMNVSEAQISKLSKRVYTKIEKVL